MNRAECQQAAGSLRTLADDMEQNSHKYDAIPFAQIIAAIQAIMTMAPQIMALVMQIINMFPKPTPPAPTPSGGPPDPPAPLFGSVAP